MAGKNQSVWQEADEYESITACRPVAGQRPWDMQNTTPVTD
jgi:hypothetical protein